MHYFQKVTVGILAVLCFIQCGRAAMLEELKKESVWAVKIGDLGYIAFDYLGNRNGPEGPREVWWFIEKVRLRGEFDGAQLKTYYRDHKNNEQPAFIFTFVEGRGFQLEAGGLLPSPLPAPFAGVVLARMPPDTWYNLTNNYYRIWHEAGSLKELPANWPPALAESTARLLSGQSHELARALAVPTLSKEILAEAYRWTKEKPSWKDQGEWIHRVIAANPSCDQTTLKELWQIPGEPVVWYTAARNRNAPKEWVEGFAERILKGSARDQVLLMYCKELTPELLDQLAEKGCPDVFSGVIKAPNATTHALEIICKRMKTERGNSPYNWEDMAANSKAPEWYLRETAEKAIKSKSERCLSSLASNPTLPVDMRDSVAEARFLSVFADAKSFWYYNPSVLSDPYLEPKHFTQMIGSLLPSIRAGVAGNTALNDEQLRQLASDPVESVSKVAISTWTKKHPSTPLTGLPPTAGKHRVDDATLIREKILSGNTAEALAIWQQIPKTHFTGLGNVTYWGKDRDPFPPILNFIAAVEPEGGPLAESFLLELVRGAPELITEMKKRGVLGKVRAFSAFEQALSLKNPSLIQILLEAGLDANSKGEGSRTPLMMAALHGDVESTKLLLKYGASIATQDGNRRRASDYAFQALKPEVMALLVETADDKARLKKLQDQLSPAAAGSPFVGHWTNGKDGFYTVIVQLHDNGSFVFAGGMLSLQGKWKPQGADRVVANPIWPEETGYTSPQQREELVKFKAAFRELIFVQTSNPERLQLTKPDGTSVGDPLVREKP